jgi:hypothetical protein
MTEQSPAQYNNIVSVEGNTLTLKIGDYRLSIKIEGPEVKPGSRVQLEAGQTLFDLVLDAAGTFVRDIGENKFTAAALYHIAREKHPALDIRRNSWNSHVMSSAPNHPSYKHYTSHRNYFRYQGNGEYTLDSKWTETENKVTGS